VPELPDLVHVQATLARTVCNRCITEVRVGDPVVLRLMVPGALTDLLLGKRIVKVERVGQFLRFDLDQDLVLVINAMLSGRYFVVDGDARIKHKNLVLAVRFEGGRELRYDDDTRMGKIYVAAAAQASSIPGFRDLGVDLLSPAFTLEHFRRVFAKRRDQVRQFLLDKTALASIGNAYADEILFAAKLHPKTLCRQLDPSAVDRLYAAIRDTLAWAIRTVEERDQPIEIKVRDFLKVRGRAGKPCFDCNTILRRVRVGRDDACFCPHCQPSTRKLFVDFSRLPPSGRG
jgi:formamidopyrimidine-DNA glycosylase